MTKDFPSVLILSSAGQKWNVSMEICSYYSKADVYVDNG